MKRQGITKLISIHPQWGMDVCPKFNWDIWLKTTIVNLLVALEEESGDDHSQSGDHERL